MEEWLPKVVELITFYGIKIIAALVVFIVGRWIAKGVEKLTAKVLVKRNVDPTIVSFVEHLVYIALITFVIIAALAQLGIQTTSFIAVIGAAGLAIGLALQGSLANFAAGFLMIIFRPFKAGDYIEGGGAVGTVEKIEVFTTTLKTVDNKVIIIPNAKMMGDNIINYSAKDTRRVDLNFGVSYGDDIDKVRKILADVVDKESRILKDPETMIIVKELADSSVNFQVRAWVKTADYWGVYFDMIETVKKQFDAADISIPFPQRDVHVYEHK
ncbi:MAG TPA: mechanosensitive ion channel [Deltaproteobacteria bacterium]|nr:mechanosensitive ion channel [Deltaproteobacteria bacterium]HPR51144.1 mechanosensitive ion channel [Deltaproteobacteria bacterium]